MTKRDRTTTPGAHFLVTNRGTAQTMIYRSDDDRRSFLSLLGSLEETFGINVLAYVLMGNHYHLVLRQAEPRLSEAMQYVDGTHARRFNALHDRQGALFQGRYDARLLSTEVGLQGAGYYLHLNPRRAGIVNDDLVYRWSSLGAYARGRSALRWLRLDLLAGRSGSEYVAGVRRRIGSFGRNAGADPADTSDFAHWCSAAELEASFAASDRRVADQFDVSVDELYVLQPGKVNTPRAVGIAHALRVAGLPAPLVADRYGLRSRDGVYAAVGAVRRCLERGGAAAAAVRSLGLDD